MRSEFDVDLTERELSAVVASLNEGGADADAELVDGQRFLKRMNMLNSTARRLPRVEKTPVAGDWIRNERYNARPITADRYTNQDLFSPKRQFAKFTAVRPVRRGSANSDARDGPHPFSGQEEALRAAAAGCRRAAGQYRFLYGKAQAVSRRQGQASLWVVGVVARFDGVGRR